MDQGQAISRANLEKLAIRIGEQGLVCSLKCVNQQQLYIEINQEQGRIRGIYYVVGWTADPDVPVLYFNAYENDQLITDIDVIYHTLVPKVYQSSVYGSITQGEHPILGYPSFFIHPCQTKELLKVLTIDRCKQAVDSDVLYTWLQTFGSIVGLKLLNQ
jgi:ubiquitin-like-conjugating enzyme ATG10